MQFIENQRKDRLSPSFNNQARLYKENYLDSKQQLLKQNKRKGNLNIATASRNGTQSTMGVSANSDTKVRETRKAKFILKVKNL